MNLENTINSLVLATSVTFLSLVAGLAIGILRSCQQVALRRLIDLMAFACWMVPPFLFVESWMRVVSEPVIGLAPMSIWGCIAVMTMAQWPLSYFLIVNGMNQSGSRDKITASGLTGWSFIKHVYLPTLKPWMSFAALIAFASAWSAFSTPSLFNVKVISSQIWLNFNTSFDFTSLMIPVLVHTLIPVILCGLYFRSVRFEILIESAPCPASVWVNAIGRTTSLATSTLGIAILITCLFFGVWQSLWILNQPDQWIEIARANAAPLVQSAILGAAVLPILILVGIGISRWNRAPHLWVFWFIPGLCLSFLTAWFINLEPVARFYQSGLEILVLSLSLRFIPIAAFLFATVRGREFSTSTNDYFRLVNLSWWRRWIWVDMAKLRTVAPAVVVILLPMVLWDIETTLLIVPPGGETAVMRIFGLLHYGHNDQVLGLCLLLAVIIFLAVGIAWIVSRIRFQSPGSMIAVAILTLPTLIFSGCHSENLDNSTTSSNSSVTHRTFPLTLKNGQPSRFFEKVQIIGTRGNAPGKFQKTRSLTINGNDQLFVSDMTGRIQRFSNIGQFELMWQMKETELGKPKGMGIDYDGNVIVIEPHYGRVNHFAADGTLVHQWGFKGKAPGELDLPRSITQTSTNSQNYIVCEFGGHDRIQWFDQHGNFTGKSVGSNGTEDGQFDRPESVVLDINGNILVADSCNHRIQIFSPAGKWITSHGSSGSNHGEFSYPYDIKVTRAGYIFICEFGNSRIQIFDSSWNHIESIGSQGRNPGQFFNPWMMAFDSEGNLYVADSMNHRVQKLLRNAHNEMSSIGENINRKGGKG